ncbi:MAG: hypothetical protein K2I97_03790, partial [Alistipes sp.]|nr:hypothetical protein [Alistipes sp.]
HIWKPEIDPTSAANLLEYKYTNSGTYHVMPIALGATAKVDIGPTGTATANTLKTYGLLYQWGRKDPLGRPGALAANTFATTYAGATGTTAFNLTSINIKDSSLLGSNDAKDKDGGDLDDFMIDYVTKHPTHIIIVDNAAYENDWAGKNNPYLWGNPTGYDYPRNSTLQRTIFEPCPKGYRVAPRDLWIAFTTTGSNITQSLKVDDPSTWAENMYNVLNVNTSTHKMTGDVQRGHFFCYEVDENNFKKWREGASDFYPAIGYLNRNTGGITAVGLIGYYWCSSPNAAGAQTSGNVYSSTTSYVYPINNGGRASGAAIRCVREH